jgi:SCP-2 sterol transfer family
MSNNGIIEFSISLKLVAEIYRPAAEIMMHPSFKEIASDILDATTQAGRELVKSMKISDETIARIRQPVMDSQLFAKTGNVFWKTCIAEGVTPKEFREKNMVPRPDSIDDFMLFFPVGINSEAAGGGKVILQFNFSGQVEDSCYFNIEKGKVVAKTGTFEDPELTIETPFDVWIDIMTGKADGQQMFMEQKYKVTGDISLMIELFQRKSDK